MSTLDITAIRAYTKAVRIAVATYASENPTDEARALREKDQRAAKYQRRKEHRPSAYQKVEERRRGQVASDVPLKTKGRKVFVFMEPVGATHADPRPATVPADGSLVGRGWRQQAKRLRERPGEWALIGVGMAGSVAPGINAGKCMDLRPAGAFEAVMRNYDSVTHRGDLFIRFVGEPR